MLLSAASATPQHLHHNFNNLNKKKGGKEKKSHFKKESLHCLSNSSLTLCTVELWNCKDFAILTKFDSLFFFYDPTSATVKKTLIQSNFTMSRFHCTHYNSFPRLSLSHTHTGMGEKCLVHFCMLLDGIKGADTVELGTCGSPNSWHTFSDRPSSYNNKLIR